MPKASVKRSIECSKDQLIDLVLDIEKYPIFVPFCLDAKVHKKKPVGLVFIGIKKGNKTLIRKYLFKKKKRIPIQRASVSNALNLILSFIK